MKIDSNEDGVGRAFPRPMGYDNGSGIVQAVAAATPLPVAATINGATATARFASSAASNNATLVKNAAGTVTQISGTNKAATTRYLRLYDKATTPVPASDAARMVYELPAGAAFVFDGRDVFATGIGYAITGALADLDNTAIAAGDITCFNLDYL